jgi:predicted DNA binding CopG/RHH family protein
MLAQQDTNIAKAVTTVHRLIEDEELRQQLGHDYWYNAEIKKRDAALSEKDVALHL